MKRIINSLLLVISLIVFQSCSKEEPETPPIAIAIGDFHEGGVIFYLDDTGEHGLVSAVSDESFEAPWGCLPLVVNGAEGLEIGTGAQNTIDIVTTCNGTTIAASLCDQLVLNDYDDWFLPSKDELDMLYQNREKVNETAIANGGHQLEDAEYWSSSTLGSDSTFGQHFTAGNQFVEDEDALFNVRAIRAF